jgi:hypothetical protein
LTIACCGEIGGISCRRGSPAPSAAVARDGLCCGPLFDTVSTTRSNLLRIRDKLDIICDLRLENIEPIVGAAGSTSYATTGRAFVLKGGDDALVP